MKNTILLLFTLLLSLALFSQSTVDYKNHYEISIVNIKTEELAKITIGHLRTISHSKRCDFYNDNDTFIIKTNSKISEPYLTDELNKIGYTLLNYIIIKEAQ